MQESNRESLAKLRQEFALKTILKRFNCSVAVFVALACLLTLAPPILAQVAVAPLQLVRQQFLSSTGVPLANGCVQFFATGTSTPQAIYADSTGTSQLPNPLTLDGAGETSVWMTNTGYDIVANTGAQGFTCAANVGSLVWRENNKNPFSIINGGSNYIVASGTVDPSGSAGELAYRTDIPCFRGFTTIWDCFAELTLPQTLSAKTLTSPILNTPTSNQGTFNTPSLNTPSLAVSTPFTITYPNFATAGTTTNLLVAFDKSNNAGVTVRTWCGAGCGNPTNGAAIGICVSGCGTTGNAQIAVSGLASCSFDGSTTVGDYVGISQINTASCTDTGAAYPTSGQVIGRVFSTNVGAGTYPVELTAQPEVKAPTVVVAVANLTAQAANISSTPIFTPTANGFYRFSCYIVLTQAGTISSTLPQCNLFYTDADSSFAESFQVCNTSTSNTVGQTCIVSTNGNPFHFFAKTGVAISYTTTGYASSGATPMQYSVHIRLEGPL